MTPKALPAPLERLARDHVIELRDGFRGWIDRQRWKSAVKGAKEDRLSESGLSFLDLMNLCVRRRTDWEKSRVWAYERIAWMLAYMPDEDIDLWRARAEQEHSLAVAGTPTRHAYLALFLDKFRINQSFLYEDDHWAAERAVFLSNYIRLRPLAGDDSAGAPLVNRDGVLRLLAPDFDIWERRLSDREILTAAGIIKLDRAWMVRDDSEREKIKRFMQVHADEADYAVQIVQSRFVSSLEHLESLMGQSRTTALMEGAL